MLTTPKISIITVVRNGEKHIEGTILSIINQTYKNIEYIIIDGKSNDKTVSIIEKYDEHISYWISESDSGIYDAMNKAVAVSTGDWLIFINSDDFLASNTVIDEFIPSLVLSKNLVVYGQIIYMSDGYQTEMGKEWTEIRDKFRKFGMLIPHQGTFHAKKLFLKNLFNTKFKIAGDYEFLLRYLKQNDAMFVPIIVSKMRSGGISDSNSPMVILEESLKAQQLNGINTHINTTRWVIMNAFFLLYSYTVSMLGIKFIRKIKGFIRYNVTTKISKIAIVY